MIPPSFDFVTPMCVMWSLGSAQVTYVAVGPGTFAYGVYGTGKLCFKKKLLKKGKLSKCWKPFGTATVCLVPIIGGIVGSKILDH